MVYKPWQINEQINGSIHFVFEGLNFFCYFNFIH